MNIKDYVLDIHLKNKKLGIKYGYVLKKEAITSYKKHEDKRFFCPICKEPLVGAQGNIKAHYFRHSKKEEDKKCESLILNSNKIEQIINNIHESELHKKIKYHLNRYKTNKLHISIPHFNISLNDFDDFNSNFQVLFFLDGIKNKYHLEKKEIIQKRIVEILDIEEEVRQENKDHNFVIIPDLVIKCRDIENNEIISYNIEIVVTHGVDNQKLKKIQKNKVNCIQIDGNKWSKLSSLLKLDNISTYLFSVEHDIALIYEDLYKEYETKTKTYNDIYILKNDKQDIFFRDNKKPTEKFCFYCNKTLQYDKKHLIYRHKKNSDFQSCIKNDSVNINILSYFQENGIEFYLDKGEVCIQDNTLDISYKPHLMQIKPEQIDITLFNELIKKEQRINLLDILRLTPKQQELVVEQKNLFSNLQIVIDSLVRVYNKDIIIDSIKKECPLCYCKDQKHQSHCSFLKNTDIKSKIEQISKNIIKDKLSDAIKEKEILNSKIIINIFNLLKKTKIMFDPQQISFSHRREDTQIFINIGESNVLLFTVYFRYKNEDIYLYEYIKNKEASAIFEYNLLSEYKDIEFYEPIVNKNISVYFFSYELKTQIEYYILKKSKIYNKLVEPLEDVESNCFITNNNNYSIFIRANHFLNFYFNHEDKIKNNKIPVIHIDYSYDSYFNIIENETIYFNTNNLLILINFYINSGWLQGLDYPLKSKKNITEIKLVDNSNYQIYNIEINKVQHSLYFHEQSTDYINYDLSIDISFIKDSDKFLTIDNLQHLLFKYKKYIQYNTYSSTCIIANENKQREENKIKLQQKEKQYKSIIVKREIRQQEIKRKNHLYISQLKKLNSGLNLILNERESTIIIPNHIKKQFMLLEDKLFYIRFSNIASNINLTSSSEETNLIKNTLKVKTKTKNIFLLPLFLEEVSLEDNFILFLFNIRYNPDFKIEDKNNNKYIFNAIKINDKLPDYILFFQHTKDNIYNIDNSKKLNIDKYFVPGNKIDCLKHLRNNLTLIIAYLVKTKQYSLLNTFKSVLKSTFSEGDFFKKFPFLTEQDTKECLKAIIT